MIDWMIFETWWFIAVLIAGSAMLIWSGLRLRLAAAQRRELELQSMVDLRTQEVRSLGSLTEKINTAVRLDEVLEHVWDSFRMVLPYNRIGFAEVDDEIVRAVWARSDASAIKIDTGYSAPIGTTSLGRILETGKPRIINNLAIYLERHPQSDATRAVVEEGMLASMTVPLRAMGHEVGFLFFSSRTADIYTDKHVRLLARISGQLSLAIEKSRLYDRLLETTKLLEEANERLEYAASTDALTGIANRRVFDERIAVEWRRCRRNGKPLSVLMIDIDSFKRFNDLHGHIAGDDCLRTVAETLSTTLGRAADLVARYGGDEFGAILPETSQDEAVKLANELRLMVAGLKLETSGSIAVFTVSIGVATEVPTEQGSSAHLIRSADASLYIAKHRGRNLVHSTPLIDVPGGFFESEG